MWKNKQRLFRKINVRYLLPDREFYVVYTAHVFLQFSGNKTFTFFRQIFTDYWLKIALFTSKRHRLTARGGIIYQFRWFGDNRLSSDVGNVNHNQLALYGNWWLQINNNKLWRIIYIIINNCAWVITFYLSRLAGKQWT